jgi:hypothetical protein
MRGSGQPGGGFCVDSILFQFGLPIYVSIARFSAAVALAKPPPSSKKSMRGISLERTCFRQP